jgi:hypothetical protein
MYPEITNKENGGVGGDSGERVSVTDPLEVAEYNEGYDYNERFGDKKDYS